MKQKRSHSLEETEGGKEKLKVVNKVPLFTTTEDYVHSLLIPWFQQHGFIGLEYLDFRYSPACGNSLGCFAKKSYCLDEVIFEIPQTAIFSLHSVQPTALTSFVRETVQCNNPTQIIPNEFLLWIHMIAENLGNTYRSADAITTQPKRDNLQLYFQSLRETSSSIISWKKDLLVALQGTNLGKSIQDLQDHVDLSVKLIEMLHEWSPSQAEHFLPRQSYHEQTFRWAAGHYLSRRYPSYFGDYSAMVTSSSQSVKLSVQEEEERFLGNPGSLVPLLDLLNHNSDRSWIRFQILDNKLQIICNFPIEQGQEIFSNYGMQLSNGQLLFAYGYAIEDNPHDEYLLNLKIPNLPLFRSLLSPTQPPTEGDQTSTLTTTTNVMKRFAIKRGGISGIPETLLNTLELLDLYQQNPSMGTSSPPPLPVQSLIQSSPTITFQSVNLEKYERIMPFLFHQFENMMNHYPTLCQQLKLFQVDLDFSFPERLEEGDLLISRDLFESSVQLTYDVNQVDQRAVFIAYYLISQYQVVVEVIQEIDYLFQSLDQEEVSDDEEKGESRD